MKLREGRKEGEGNQKKVIELRALVVGQTGLGSFHSQNDFVSSSK